MLVKLLISHIRITTLRFSLLFLSSWSPSEFKKSLTTSSGTNFEKALQTFKVLVKKSPSNPSYNYYYGACCYETGNVVEAIPYLEKSAKRNYINAFRYLGKAYYDQYRFDEAVDCYEQHISLAEDKKRNTEAAEAELSQVHKAALMYKSVEDVAVIDSFVVAKENFLNAYRLSKETGKLTQQDRTITYETEMGNQQILSQPNEEGTYQLYTRNKLINGWSEPVAVNSLNDLGNVNYPFLMGDGITFYFSSDGDGSLGGYDIFVSMDLPYSLATVFLSSHRYRLSRSRLSTTSLPLFSFSFSIAAILIISFTSCFTAYSFIT